MLSNIKKKIILSVIIGAIVYLLFIFYANLDSFLNSLAQFNPWLIPLILLLSLANFVIRFYKWDFYLKKLSVKLNKVDSFLIFMSGLVMSITPGKIGEFLKSFLVKEITTTSMSITSPIIIVERITDSIAFILLSLLGAYIFDYGRDISIAISIIVILSLIVLSSPKMFFYLIKIFKKSSFLNKHLSKIEIAYNSIQILIKPGLLIYMTFISLIAWFAECLGYYLILSNFKVEVSLVWATFSYAFSNIVGTISMLPGGLGAAEGSLTYLLLKEGVSKSTAVTTTFLIRAFTLWFSVIVGSIAITVLHRRNKKIVYNKL